MSHLCNNFLYTHTHTHTHTQHAHTQARTHTQLYIPPFIKLFSLVVTSINSTNFSVDVSFINCSISNTLSLFIEIWQQILHPIIFEIVDNSLPISIEHTGHKLSMIETLLHLPRACITKTCLYKFDPLKPHFCIVKLWFTGVYIIFLISARRGGSNEYPQSMF